MKYYKITQCRDPVNILSIPPIKPEELEDGFGLVRQIQEKYDSVFLHFYENPYPIVSNRLKEVIDAHQPSAIWQPLALANINTKFLLLYWLLNLEPVSGKLQNKTLILNREEIGDKKIFKVKTGLMEYTIVRLDLAEHMLFIHNIDINIEEVITDA